MLTEILKAVFLGLVEGITEWLPVSSTGHLILVEAFLKMKASDEFKEMFDVVIQLGAILAVVVIYWDKIFPFRFKRPNPNPLGKSALGGMIQKDILQLWCKIIVACMPAAIIGLAFDELFNRLFYNPISVAIMLILVGIVFIFVERLNKEKTTKIHSIGAIDYQTAVMIGIFQLIAAIFPGTSRSGATIIGALLMGVSRTAAAEFTFYLAIPVMAGASLLKLLKFGLHFAPSEVALLAFGMITAYLVSMFIIRFLMNYIRKHDFTMFGYYRIAVGLIVLVLVGFHVI